MISYTMYVSSFLHTQLSSWVKYQNIPQAKCFVYWIAKNITRYNFIDILSSRYIEWNTIRFALRKPIQWTLRTFTSCRQFNVYASSEWNDFNRKTQKLEPHKPCTSTAQIYSTQRWTVHIYTKTSPFKFVDALCSSMEVECLDVWRRRLRLCDLFYICRRRCFIFSAN